MRIIVALIFLLAAPALSLADVPDLEFGGQRYHLGPEYQDEGAGGAGFSAAEFTLDGETVPDWTKLFAFHNYPGLDAEPAVAAATVRETVLEQYKDASLAITDVPGSDEAILDFLTYDPDRDVMEFDVFKYARAADGEGLMALQFAQRFPAADFDKKAFPALRARIIDEMARTNVAPAQAYFAAKAKS